LHRFAVTDPQTLAMLAVEAGLTGASIVLAALDEPAWEATHEPNRLIYPASMIKVPIAATLAERCTARSLDWGERVRVAPANLTANDAPSPFVAGYEATLGELARAAIALSDNTATNVLIDVLGRENVAIACERFGLRATAVRRKLSGSLPLIVDPEATGRNAHPAADAALLFAAIARDDATELRFVRAALAAQHWNDKLTRGLLPGDTFAHKTGDTDECSHDGGILTLENGRRFIIVVYTTLAAGPETDVLFGNFMSALRPYLS
jgi:beta-lactamase class A